MKRKVVIIGGGPAGYSCAVRCAQLGLHPILIEETRLGGVCLHAGCIPTKALLKNAQVARLVHSEAANYGVFTDHVRLDYKVGVSRSKKVVSTLQSGLTELLKYHNVEIITARASVVAPGLLSLSHPDGTQTTIKAENIVIATGASPSMPAKWDLDRRVIFDFRGALALEELPSSMIIIGAGAIGMEFATLFHSYGVDITIIEREAVLLPSEDRAISTEIERRYRNKGITTYVGTEVQDVLIKDKMALITFQQQGSPHTHTLESETILVATGFRAQLGNTITTSLPLKIDKLGWISIDNRMQTSIEGIWAIGDVTGKSMLAHSGYLMGRVCAESIAKVPTQTNIDYTMIPRAVFTDPNIASFGYTETQLQARNIPYKKGLAHFKHNGKAIAFNQTEGWILILADERYGEVLGLHAIGADVAELLGEVTLAQGLEATVDELINNIHLHPSYSEALWEAVAQIREVSLHS